MAQEHTQLCEVCSTPVPATQAPLRVGSCEFPFHVHDECLAELRPVAGFVEELCVLSDEQPEGLLNLGSWSDERQSHAADVPADAEPSVAEFVDAYLEGGTLPVGGALNVENGAVYLHGWWPVAVQLAGEAYLVRAEPDPEGRDLNRLVIERLAAHGLRRCAVDDRLLESIALQRLGLLGATWETWATDDETAHQAVAAGAAG